METEQMDSSNNECAVSSRTGKTSTNQWHAIDWQKAHRSVRKLQVRIVKAEQEGKRGKVQALQRLLTSSFYAKALAVKRVTENQGRRTDFYGLNKRRHIVFFIVF